MPADVSCSVADIANARVLYRQRAPAFPDVALDHWTYHEIQACVETNIGKGYRTLSATPETR